MTDQEAMTSWLRDGTVTASYLARSLGDQSVGVSPHLPKRAKIFGRSDLAETECPFPPEPGYEKAAPVPPG